MTENHPTVLLLEDDQQLGMVLKDSLELKKYKVEWQTRADRALQLFEAEKYDICLVDETRDHCTSYDGAITPVWTDQSYIFGDDGNDRIDQCAKRNSKENAPKTP